MAVVQKDESTEYLEEALQAICPAFLSHQFHSKQGDTVNTALLISSLEIPPSGIRDSGRAIEVFVVPSKLDVDDILTNWWYSSNNHNILPTDKFKLKLVATTISNLPRILEAASTYIQEKPKKGQPFDKDFYGGLFTHIDKQLASRYGNFLKMDSIDNKYLRALVFGESIEIDKNVISLIRSSTYTNSLTAVGRSKNPVFIIPESSIEFLAATLSNGTISLLSPSYCIQSAHKSLREIISGKPRPEGDALEVIAIKWLQVRIAVGKLPNKKYIKFYELFALIQKDNTDFDIQLPSEDDYFKMCSLPVLRPTISDNVNENEAFFKVFNKANLFFKDDLRIFQSIAGQRWDFMITTYRLKGDDWVPFIIFVECKSKRVKDPVNSSIEKTFPQDLIQYNRVLEFVKYLKDRKDLKEQNDLSEACQALIKDDFTFIYLSTHQKNEDDVDAYQRSLGKLVIMNEYNCNNFFGPIYTFYEVARSTLTKLTN